MKRTLIAAAAFAAALPLLLAAQSLGQDASNRLNALSRKFNETRVEPGVRQEYQLKLQQIGKSTSCVDPTGKGGAGGFECRMATPQQIESAKAQAAQLERDFDALVKELAGRNLKAYYDPKLQELGQKIDMGRLDRGETEPLKLRIRNFYLTGATGSAKAGGDSPAELESRFKQLAADVDAAIKLSADSKSNDSFGMQYQQKANTVDTKIRASRLNMTVREDLLRDFNAMTAPVMRTLGGASRAPGKLSPTEWAAAMAELDAFAKRVDDTIAADGSKSMKDLYQPKLDALSKKVADARIDPTDRSTLDRRIHDLRRTIEQVGPKGGPTLDMIDADLAKLTQDIDAAIALNAERGKAQSVLAAFEAKWSGLDKKITGSRLHAAFKEDFHYQAQMIANNVRCANAKSGAASGGPLCNARDVDFTKLAEANAQVDALSAAVDNAITAYGSKSLRDIYEPMQREQRDRLMRSRVPPPDRSRLEQRLSMFMRDLDAPQGRRSQSPDTIKAAFQMIVADIDAAIRLSEATKTK